MPDLDDELAGLRDNIRESVCQPELGTLVARSQQRSSRRRRQFGAVAAVLVVGATIPLLRTALRPAPDDAVRPATPMPTTTHRLTVDAPPPGTLIADPFIYDADFADDRHGYALRGVCGPENNAECSSELLVTDDGKTWSIKKLPAALGHTIGSVSGQLVVLGPNKLLVGEIYSRGGPRFFSADAGQTWQQVAGTDDELIDTIPDGSPLLFFCQDQNDCVSKLVVIRPDSGRIATLRTPPTLTNLRPAVSLAVGGAWWVSGKNAGGQQELAVSRDAGATWTATVLPNAPADAFWVSVTAQGSTVYATVTGQLPDVKNGLVAIYRSTDGGKQWEQTWRAVTEHEPRSIGGVAIAATDGSLMVNTEIGVPYRSMDGGRTFEQLKGATAVGYVRLIKPGYLISPVILTKPVLRLSADGLHWQEISVG